MKVFSTITILLLISVISTQLLADKSEYKNAVFFADKVCGSLDIYGSSDRKEIKAESKAELGIFKKFFGSIMGDVEYKKARISFTGLLQEQVGKDKLDIRECRENMVRYYISTKETINPILRKRGEPKTITSNNRPITKKAIIKYKLPNHNSLQPTMHINDAIVEKQREEKVRERQFSLDEDDTLKPSRQLK